MAITYFHNLPGRDADWGMGNDRVLRRSWLALTDSRATSEALILPDAILNHGAPVPFLTPHPDDVAYLCKRLRAKQEKKSPLHWIIDAEYDTKPWEDEDEDEDPLDRRAKFSWSTVKYQKAVEKDRDGDAILNSAGDYFDPPPLKDTSRWTVTVTKNVEVVPTGILEWRDRLNEDEFTIDGIAVDINVAKIMSISVGDIQEDSGTQYRVLSYTLEFDEVDKWKGKYLNQGFYGFVSGEKRRIQLGSPAKDCVSPQLLTDAGVFIVNPEPSDASYEDYDIYDEMEFTGNLPLE